MTASLRELMPSIVPEEHRGRPGAAREAALAGAQQDPTRRAAYLVWAVYASIAMGEPREALRLLDAIRGDADEAIARRAWACRAWAQTLDRNWYPGNDGGEMPPDWQEGLATVDRVAPGDAETMLVENCAAYGPRMVLTFRNLMNGAARQSPAVVEQMLQHGIQSLDNFVGVAANVNAHTAACWALAVKADLQWRGGRQNEAQQALEQVRRMHTDAGDAIGVANTWIFEGDWWAAPGSSPEALGLILTGGAASVATPEPNDSRAMHAYLQATTALAQSDARWASAAVDLRLAFLAGRSGNFEVQSDRLARSERGYREVGDAAGTHLVTVHRWLADIARGDFIAVRRIAPLEWAKVHGPAAEIAAWGTTRGSLTYCTGLGRLLQRSGERWVTSGEFDRAEIAYRLASHLTSLNGAVPRWTVPEALAQLDAHRNLTTRALVRRLQTLDLLPPPQRPGVNGAPWLQDLQLTLGLLSVPTGVSGASEIGIRIIERGEQRLNALLDVAGIARAPNSVLPSDPNKAFESARAAYEVDLAAKARGLPNAEGRPAEQIFHELAASLARQALLRARPLVALLRARRAERLGWDAQGELWYRAALEDSASAGAENRWLEILILNAWGKRAEARAALKTALQEHLIESSMLASLAVRVGDYDSAQKLFRTLPMESGSTSIDWRDEADRAEAAIECGDGATALKLASRAISKFEDIVDRLPRDADRVAACDDVSAASLYLLVARIHLRLAQATDRHSDPDASAAQTALVFDVTDRHRVLAMPPGWRRSNGADPPMTETLLQWQQAATEHATAYQRLLAALTLGTGKVASLTEVLAEAERALAEIEATLTPEQQAAIVEARRSRPSTAEETQRFLPTGACLLEYQVVGRDYIMLAITDSTVAAHHGRLDRGTFEGLASRLLRACAAGAPSPEADELAAILLEPFASILERHERVIVVPSGALNTVPFHVLPIRGRPLCETHTVSYLPAATLLARSTVDRPLAAGGTLVVGDPAFEEATHPSLRRLAGAAVEANVVAKIYGTADTYVAEDAKKATLRPLLRDRALLHFAAHGRLDDIAPNTSSIVLAGNDELTVSDLIGLNIGADLAVLSACDTGRGTTTLGGDLVGLVRGLTAAGVHRCVVSLWPVDDVAACVTMADFHRHLKDGAAPAFALALAQREIRTLSGTEIAERYRSLGGALAPGRRAIRRKAKGVTRQLPMFPEVDAEDADMRVEAQHGQLASIWAPFVLIGV
jgi:CHAT domain-containing protein